MGVHTRAIASAALLGAWVGLGLGLGTCAFGGESPRGTPANGRLQLLDSGTRVRFSVGLKTPLYAAADGALKVPQVGKRDKRRPLPDFEVPAAPPAWREPGFDDSGWSRLSLPWEQKRIGHENEGYDANKRHLACARARFFVRDPGSVRQLKLSLPYIGGVVVFLNGREVARGHMPAGKIEPGTHAKRYVEDPYTDKDGKYAVKEWDAKDPERYATRWRRLESASIPASALRKGVNVLAIENHRAPVHEAQVKGRRKRVSKHCPYVPSRFAYIGIGAPSLTAAGSSAVVPKAAGDAGLVVRACPPDETIVAGRFARAGAPWESPRLSITGARNGTFSGRLVATSAGPIGQLRARVGDLVSAGTGKKIPASALLVRYAARAKHENSWVGLRAPRGALRFDALLEEAPAAVRPGAPGGAAVQPVWVTVRVPSDAAPGVYSGQISVSAEGRKPVNVPLRLKVHAWRVPDPKDFRTCHLGHVSLETPALYYKNVPTWSDRHFEMIGKTHAMMAEIAGRAVFVNLAVNYKTHGNRESLVRWIKPGGKPGNGATGNGRGYRYDFSVFDRYLDVVASSMGKPRLLVLNMWDQVKEDKKTGRRRTASGHAKYVSLLDPATGKLEKLEAPVPSEPEMIPFWKPVLREIRKRLEKRGWMDVTAAGDVQYCGMAHPAVVSNFRAIWPDGKWFSQQHGGYRFFKTTNKKSVPLIANTTVWGEGRVKGRFENMWKSPSVLAASFARNRHDDRSPLVLVRVLPEDVLMRGMWGVGPLGGNYWPIKDYRGRWTNLGGQSAVGPQCSTRALVVPGPDGPVASERFEAFRQGVQTCEAILYLQKALDQGKLNGQLAGRVTAVIRQRVEFFKAIRSEWGRALDVHVAVPQMEPMMDRLLGLCAEVAAATGAN
jgi:hypothetical protein